MSEWLDVGLADLECRTLKDSSLTATQLRGGTISGPKSNRGSCRTTVDAFGGLTTTNVRSDSCLGGWQLLSKS